MTPAGTTLVTELFDRLATLKTPRATTRPNA